MYQVFCSVIDQGLVVQKVDNAIQWIVQSVFLMTYPLDNDLSDGKRYLAFEQLGPVLQGLDYERYIFFPESVEQNARHVNGHVRD